MSSQNPTTYLRLLLILALLLPALPGRAAQSDFAQDVAITADPSPRNLITGSSLNQYGKNQVDSQVDNYLHQDEQINLSEDTGTIRVLRTNQKALINEFVTVAIPLANANPRELRGLARTICRKEGGDADVLQDKVSGKNYLVVVCPEFQIPYLTRTLSAIDETWISEAEDGAWLYYYQGRNRDVRNLMQTLQLYRTPDGIWEFDDANNAVLFEDQPCIGGLFKWGTENVDIVPSQLIMDVAIYEIDTQNRLDLGLDFETWKNGPGRDLFDFIFWDFGGDDLGLFPGSLPGNAQDWGRYRSYHFLLTTEYIDFLQTKGRARLLTRTTISAKSGTAADIAAVDSVASFRVDASTDPTNIRRSVPFKLSEVYDDYQPAAKGYPTAPVLLGQKPSDAIQIIDSFLQTQLGAAEESRAAIGRQLAELAKDGSLTQADLDSVYVSLDIVLQTFHDRTLRYLQSGQVGVLMSILPVVGLSSAEMAVSIDLSDVTGYTPAGLPIIEHRYFSTAIEVADGVPFVLSGMTRSTSVRRGSGIPYLREIPGLGYLFGNEITEKHERELVVLVTPRFELALRTEADPPEAIREAIRLMASGEEPDVPADWLGFDQWLLDPDRRNLKASE